jgi:hypothetical protein
MLQGGSSLFRVEADIHGIIVSHLLGEPIYVIQKTRCRVERYWTRRCHPRQCGNGLLGAADPHPCGRERHDARRDDCDPVVRPACGDGDAGESGDACLAEAGTRQEGGGGECGARSITEAFCAIGRRPTRDKRGYRA